MSKVPLRRFAVLALIVMLVAGCKSRPMPVVPANDCASTSNGVQNHDTPLVCVDGSGELMVNPSSIRLWNHRANGSLPTIQWITRSGHGNLQIAMKATGCVEPPVCNGHGHCGAKVLRGLGDGATAGTVLATCGYTVTLDGKTLDPDAVIVACCSDQ